MSCDSGHIPFGSNIWCMHSYSSVSISTRNLKCLALPITKIWLGAKILKNGSRDHDHAPFKRNLSSLCWDKERHTIAQGFRLPITSRHCTKTAKRMITQRTIAYMLAKFDNSSFSRSGGMVDAYQNLYGSRDLTTPLSGMICHPWAGTCYDQPVYQIRSLYLYPLRRY